MSEKQTQKNTIGASNGERRFTIRFGPAVVILVLLVALGSFLVFAGFTPITPTDAVLLGLFIANVLGIFLVFCFVLGEAYALYKARRAGVAASQLHIQIVGLFSIIAALPLSSWLGSAQLRSNAASIHPLCRMGGASFKTRSTPHACSAKRSANRCFRKRG